MSVSALALEKNDRCLMSRSCQGPSGVSLSPWDCSWTEVNFVRSVDHQEHSPESAPSADSRNIGSDTTVCTGSMN